MNLRTLKKLSKRALPLLIAMGEKREPFRSEREDNYHGLIIRARKHWERMRCHPSHQEERGREKIVYTSRSGHRIVMWSPSHPRKGTIMFGAMVGYYEPEWVEETAWGLLHAWVFSHFTDWSDPEEPRLTRRLDTPNRIFAAAREMAAKKVDG